MVMRIARQRVSSAAAARADAAFERHGAESAAGTPPALDVDGRQSWFDAYVAAEGAFVEVCGRRFAPFAPDPVVAQMADLILAGRHPGLGIPLGFEPASAAVRAEWMDIYVEFGGRVDSMCDPERC
jgi:hypothetical protein